MTNDEKRTQKTKETLEKLIRESTENYLCGKRKAVWEEIKSYGDGSKIVGVIYPNQNGVDINYVCNELPYGDLGLTIGTINFDLIGMDTVVWLAICMIDSYEND